MPHGFLPPPSSLIAPNIKGVSLIIYHIRTLNRPNHSRHLVLTHIKKHPFQNFASFKPSTQPTALCCNLNNAAPLMFPGPLPTHFIFVRPKRDGTPPGRVCLSVLEYGMGMREKWLAIDPQQPVAFLWLSSSGRPWSAAFQLYSKSICHAINEPICTYKGHGLLYTNRKGLGDDNRNWMAMVFAVWQIVCASRVLEFLSYLHYCQWLFIYNVNSKYF